MSYLHLHETTANKIIKDEIRDKDAETETDSDPANRWNFIRLTNFTLDEFDD